MVNSVSYPRKIARCKEKTTNIKTTNDVQFKSFKNLQFVYENYKYYQNFNDMINIIKN